ncbi:MAG: hypothetical protein FWH03_06235 [Firmicutes bacterium]|nr:hypothetical protein [Bacillota bacterium]
MLKIINVVEEDLSAEVIVDSYVPISVKFAENPFFAYCYCFFQSENDSLIEIKINSKTLRISEIIIVNINTFSVLENRDCFDYPKQKGNPLIDVEYLQARCQFDIQDKEKIYARLKNNFALKYDKGKVYILLESQKPPIKIISMPNVELLLNVDDEIVGLTFFDLTVVQKRTFEEYIKSKS